jgi:hypothetical protein
MIYFLLLLLLSGDAIDVAVVFVFVFVEEIGKSKSEVLNPGAISCNSILLSIALLLLLFQRMYIITILVRPCIKLNLWNIAKVKFFKIQYLSLPQIESTRNIT